MLDDMIREYSVYVRQDTVIGTLTCFASVEALWTCDFYSGCEDRSTQKSDVGLAP